MYKLFFDNKIITFTNKPTDELATGVSIDSFDSFQIAKVLQKVDNRKKLEIISADASELFGRFCSNFRLLQAAGGAVLSQGKLLMIFRNGRWDLPKGHIESGESSERCAVREVEEECSVSGVELGRYLTSTRHIYSLGGEWCMKLTHWYAMSMPEPCATAPQREEGIEIAQWVDMESVDKLLENSYSTIEEVIRELRDKSK